MTTKLKPVEEQVEQYAQSIQDMYFLAGARVSIDTWNNTKDLVRNAIDRHTIYTALKEGVEAMRQDENPTEDGVPVETYGYEETHNQVLDQTLTLLDELFGVSK